MKKFMLAAPLAIVSVAAYGQAVSVNGGAIQGTITDPSGAAVPNATITIVSADQGSTKSITSDKSGFYSVGPLNPGTYKVTISAAGFQNTEVTTRILTGTATPGSFKLTVGKSSDTIEVSAGDIQVNTDQAGVSDVITREQIASLPVNGRNFLDLAQIEPGVQLTNGNTFDPDQVGLHGHLGQRYLGPYHPHPAGRPGHHRRNGRHHDLQRLAGRHQRVPAEPLHPGCSR